MSKKTTRVAFWITPLDLCTCSFDSSYLKEWAKKATCIALWPRTCACGKHSYMVSDITSGWQQYGGSLKGLDLSKLILYDIE